MQKCNAHFFYYYYLLTAWRRLYFKPKKKKKTSIQKRKHDHLLRWSLLHKLGKHLTAALFIGKRSCVQ